MEEHSRNRRELCYKLLYSKGYLCIHCLFMPSWYEEENWRR